MPPYMGTTPISLASASQVAINWQWNLLEGCHGPTQYTGFIFLTREQEVLSSHGRGSGVHFHVFSRINRKGLHSSLSIAIHRPCSAMCHSHCALSWDQYLQLWDRVIFPLFSGYTLGDTGAEIHFPILLAEGN